jgi:hypothetical protein
MSADWPHNVSASGLMPRLRMIDSVGRIKWIPNSEFVGKDNAAWMLFTGPSDAPTIFVGRRPRGALEHRTRQPKLFFGSYEKEPLRAFSGPTGVRDGGCR